MGLYTKSLGFLVCIAIVEMVAFYNSIGLCNTLYRFQTNGDYTIVGTEESNSASSETKDVNIVRKEVLRQMTMNPVVQSIKMDVTRFPMKQLTSIPTTPPVMITTESPREKSDIGSATATSEQTKEKESHVYDLILFTTEDVRNIAFFQIDG